MAYPRAAIVFGLLCALALCGLATADHKPKTCPVSVSRGPKGIKIYTIKYWAFPSYLKCVYPKLTVCHYDQILFASVSPIHNVYSGYSQCPTSGHKLFDYPGRTKPYQTGPAYTFLPKGHKSGTFWLYCAKNRGGHCKVGMTFPVVVKYCKH